MSASPRQNKNQKDISQLVPTITSKIIYRTIRNRVITRIKIFIPLPLKLAIKCFKFSITWLNL